MKDYSALIQSKRLPLFFLVFSIAVIWFFMFTYNFPFFWEDNWLFDAAEYSKNEIHGSINLLKMLGTNFLKAISDPVNFSYIDYYRKPLNIFYVSFLGSVFGFHVLYQRIAKTIIGGFFFVFILLFINKIVQPKRSTFSCFDMSSYYIFISLVVSYFLMLPELWILVLSLVDSLLFAIFFETITLYLFFFYYNDDSLTNKYMLSILFIAIVFFTYVTILTRHIGRINFVLFALFLFITCKRKLLCVRYFSLILVLFFFSVPIEGIIQAAFSSPASAINVLGLKSSGQVDENFFYFMFTFLRTAYSTFLPHAFFLLLLLFSFLLFHLYGYLRKNQPTNNEEEYLQFLKHLGLFSFLWFFLTVFVFNFARGVVFDRTSYLRFQYSLFVVPQAIMILCYTQYVYKRYFSTKKVIQHIVFFFIIFSVFHNIIRLNEFRGGWGAYYLGYDTVRQYIDENAKNALLVVKHDVGLPVFFFSSNSITMLSNITDGTALSEYKQNYTQLFIASPYELQFDDNSVINIANLTIRDASPYGKFKKMLGKYYLSPMYLYEFNANESNIQLADNCCRSNCKVFHCELVSSQ